MQRLFGVAIAYVTRATSEFTVKVSDKDVAEFLHDIDEGRSHFEKGCGSYNSAEVVYEVPFMGGSESSQAIYQSNASAIFARVSAIDPHNVSESASGDVFIQIGEDGFTDAIRECVKIADELAEYPILDEDSYYALRDEYVDERWEEFADEARELIDGGDADAIENAVECYVDAKGILAAKDDDAVEELARALAERTWTE